MPDNQEELSILVRMRDLASRQFAALGNKIKSFGAGAFGAFKKITGAVFSLKGALVGLGIGLAAKKLWDFFEKTEAAADRIQKLSLRIGVSTEALSELEFAAKRSGTSLEALEIGLMTASRNLGQLAATGTGEALPALLKIDPAILAMVRSGTKLEDLLPHISEELKKLSEIDRVFVASKLFGESGTKLIPLLTDDMDALRKRARELGLTLSQEAADDAAEFQDALLDLQSAIAGVKKTLVEAFAPEITKRMQELTSYLVDHRADVVEFFADMTAGAGKLASSVLGLVTSIDSLVLSLRNLSPEGAGGALREMAKSLGLIPKEFEAALGHPELDWGRITSEIEGRRGQLESLMKAIADSAESGAEALRRRANEIRQTLGALSEQDYQGMTLPSSPYEDFLSEQSAARAAEAVRQQALVEEGIRKQADAMRGMVDAFYDGVQAGSQYEDQIARLYNVGEGLEAEFQRMGEEARQFGRIAAESARAAADAIVDNLTDAILSFGDSTKSAKEKFTELANSIIADLARIALQQTLTSIVGSALGSIAGAAGGAAGGFQLGGRVPRTGLYTLHAGEEVVSQPRARYAEAVLGTRGGAGFGQQVVVNVTVPGTTPLAEQDLVLRQARLIGKITADQVNRSLQTRNRMRGRA